MSPAATLNKNQTVIRKTIPGLDILKFLLAIMIIALHTELGSYNPSVHWVLTNLFHIAVPCFFAISSFLFFRKIDSTPVNKQQSVFKKSITRYLILYLIWYILIFPFSWKIFIQPASGKEILFALLFKATDAGFSTSVVYNMYKPLAGWRTDQPNEPTYNLKYKLTWRFLQPFKKLLGKFNYVCMKVE